MNNLTRFLFLIVLMVPAVFAHADTSSTIITLTETSHKTLSEIIACGLPVVYVTTENEEEPTCDIIYAPPGCYGSTITNVNKVHSRMRMYKRINGMDSVVYDSGDFLKDSTGLTIRVRGNTSAKEDKKPYKMKLQKKADLLFRDNDSTYKDKEWVLLHDDYLLNSTGFRLSRLVGMQWVPAFCYVNLIINDRYRGVYMLTESVKRNPKCRLNVDKDCGFIFECDIYWWNESVYVRSQTQSPGYNYTFKYPDEEDITEEQLAYMQDLVNRYETSLGNGTYPDLIDTRSFAAWCLIHDIMGTLDGGGCNRYYLKYDTTDTSKIIMPLAWDFDLSGRAYNDWSRCHLVYMKKLFNSTNRTFVNEFVRLWYNLRKTIVTDMSNQLNAFGNSAEGIGLQSSYHLDNIVWGRDLWFNNLVTARRQWMSNRYNWLDPRIKALRTPNDVNLDGSVNVGDVSALIYILLNDLQDDWMLGDIDGDNNMNIKDLSDLILMVLNAPQE